MKRAKHFVLFLFSSYSTFKILSLQDVRTVTVCVVGNYPSYDRTKMTKFATKSTQNPIGLPVFPDVYSTFNPPPLTTSHNITTQKFMIIVIRIIKN